MSQENVEIIGTASTLLLWLPAIRRSLHWLAERMGSLNEGVLDRALRRGSAAP